MAPHVQPIANHTHLRRILLHSLPPAAEVEWKGTNRDDDDHLTYEVMTSLEIYFVAFLTFHPSQRWGRKRRLTFLQPNEQQ